jgi:peptidoglycan hydrolase-like protein with peptidoglycan-binding domain
MRRKKFIPLVIAGPLVAAASIIGPVAGSAQAACTVSNYLTEGKRGSDQVRCVQSSLNEKGFNSGPVDGWFGPVTRAAVVSYQTANGLVVDGEVGSQTAGSLGVWTAPQRQARQAQPARQSSSGGGGGGGGGGTSDRTSQAGGDVWDKLAWCESGGNWGINTGNGYSGGLQFLHSSWRAYGGTQYAPLAYQASREQQIAVAQNILNDVGWRAWPACTRKLGLR